MAGPASPGGYAIAGVVCAVLAWMLLAEGMVLPGVVLAVVAAAAFLVAVIGRGVQVGHRGRRE